MGAGTAVMAALLLSGSLAAAQEEGAGWELQLLITGEFRGRAFAHDADDDEDTCSAADMRSPDRACDCIGGVARTVATLTDDTLDADTLTLDAGAYSAGDGAMNYLMTTEERGNQTRAAFQDFFSRSEYNGWTLGYRDFGHALATTGQRNGGLTALATYVDELRALNPALPAPTVTNFDVSAVDEFTEAQVAEYTIMETDSGKRVALLALLDYEHLRAFWADMRTEEYEHAVERALASLDRLPRERHPDTVILMAQASIPRETVEAIVRDTVGISAVVAFDDDIGDGTSASEPWTLQNPAGDKVLLVPKCASTGFEVRRVNLHLNSHSRLLNGTAVCMPMDCSVDSSSQYPTLLDDALEFQSDSMSFMEDSVAVMDEAVEGWRCGLVSGTASPTRKCPLRQCEAPTELYLDGEPDNPFASGCGCRIAECRAGNLVADAVRQAIPEGPGGLESDVAIVNGGTIRLDELPTTIERKHILKMLPYLDPLVYLRLNGTTLKEVLQNSISQLGGAVADVTSSPDGRFLQVSGMRFTWSYDHCIGDVEDTYVPQVREVFVGDEPLVDEREYTVATSLFVK